MKVSTHQPAPVHLLNDLLDVELSSVFQFLRDGGMYLDRTTAAIHRPLAEMIAASHRRVNELAKMIDELGGTPIERGMQIEEQNLSYLSLRYLLPRLVGAKELAVARWEAALNRLGDRFPPATQLLEAQLAEHRAHLAILSKAARPKAAGT
jgi:hypothetical protein